MHFISPARIQQYVGGRVPSFGNILKPKNIKTKNDINTVSTGSAAIPSMNVLSSSPLSLSLSRSIDREAHAWIRTCKSISYLLLYSARPLY